MEYVCFHLTTEENAYLSNWYKSDFVLDGKKYNCVEQYMMYQKAMIAERPDIADKIMATDEPNVMKKLTGKGNMVLTHPNIWEGIKQMVVFRALCAKFMQNKELKEKLLATGDKIICECAIGDTDWGIGFHANEREATDYKKWIGKNMLGFALMEVRRVLKTHH